MNLRGIAKTFILTSVCATLITGTVYAREFSDVPKSFWGYDAIKEISDKNIIVGYTDGTFKPSKEVKKVEVLIILSRILGVNEESNDELVKEAESDYATALSKYDTYATREVSYLLSKGVLKTSELDKYLGNGNDEKSMLRYEIVPILTRVLGKEAELKDKGLVILDYKDAEFIPQDLRAFVEYLGNEGIMGTATDDNRFMPNGSITRAQVAALMSRVMNKIDNVEPDTTDNDSNIDEENTNTDEPNTDTTDTQDNEAVDENIISGPIQSVAVDLAGTKRSITVMATVQGVEKSLTIPVAQEVDVTIDSKKSRITLVKSADFATIELNDNKEAIKITTEKKDKTVSGIVSDVDVEKGTVSVNSDLQTLSFKAAKDIRVVKNGMSSDVSKIRKGDSVTLAIEYNLIKSINSKSIQKQVEGQISEIIISSNPKVTVVTPLGKKETYDVSKNASINIFDTKEDIYGLRLGYKAKLSLDSNEVVEINSYDQIAGVIETVVENFNEISLSPDDRTLGLSIQLLTNQNTKYISSKTNAQIQISEIKPGQKVVVCGKFGKSSFYVKEILVIQ